MNKILKMYINLKTDDKVKQQKILDSIYEESLLRGNFNLASDCYKLREQIAIENMLCGYKDGDK